MVLAHRLMAGRPREWVLRRVADRSDGKCDVGAARQGFSSLFRGRCHTITRSRDGRRALHKGFQDSVVDRAARADARNSELTAGDEERPFPPNAPIGSPMIGERHFWPMWAPARSIRHCSPSCR